MSTGESKPLTGSKSHDTRGSMPSQDEVRERLQKDAGKSGSGDTSKSKTTPNSSSPG